jgi:hypothetical protein
MESLQPSNKSAYKVPIPSRTFHINKENKPSRTIFSERHRTETNQSFWQVPSNQLTMTPTKTSFYMSSKRERYESIIKQRLMQQMVSNQHRRDLSPLKPQGASLFSVEE